MKTNPLLRSRAVLLSLAAAVTVCLTACKSSRNGELLRSFEDISAGHVSVGIKMHQVRTMSINGQMPFTDIGSLYYYKPGRGNLAAVGMTFDSKGCKQEFANSSEVIQSYETKSNDNLTVVTNLRNSLLAVSAAAASLTSLQLADFKERGESNKPPAKAEAATTDTTNTAKADALNQARTNLSHATAEAVKLMSTRNLMVFRWQADKRKSVEASAGDMVSAKFRSELGRSGFVIVAGIRSRTLYLNEADGKKLHKQVNDRLPTGWDSFLTDWLPKVYGAGFHVVSHLWEADTIAYLSEEALLRAIEAHIKVDPKNIRLSAIDQMALDLAFSSIASVANSGVMHCTGVATNSVTIGGLPRERGGCEGTWTPIMAVTTRLRDLDELWPQK